MAGVSVLPLGPARVVCRAWKHRPAIRPGVPAAVVPVQMAVDDDVNPFGIDALLGDDTGEWFRAFGQLHALFRASVHFVSTAGFDQHGVRAGFYYVAIECERNQV